jgi:hypothetical protein
MWVDEAQVQFEDQLIDAMSRPLTDPGSVGSPAPFWVANPPLKWVPAGEAVAVEDFLMLRMVNDEGSILHLGMLRDGWGFRSVSGYGWYSKLYADNKLARAVELGERDGYRLDYGPVSFPVTDVVAESIRRGRFAVMSIVLLEGFQGAGAPNI